MDKQINNKIDKHRNTYTRNGEKVDTWTVSFHDKLHPKSDKTYEDIISDENSRYFNYPLSEDEKEEGYRRFYEILDKAKLTKRQMEIIEILDKTEINFKQNKMYNQNQAAEILGCSKQNVSKHWKKIEEKIKATYKIDDIREMKLKKYEDFLDSVKTEKDVISFILKELYTYDMEYILYEIEKSELRRHFIINFINNYNEQAIFDKKTRKFCRYFLKELIDYIDLIKNNIAISKKKVDLVSPIYIEGKDGANYFF